MHNPLSEEGRQVLLGSMMGDGFLNFSGRHACFTTSASAAHLDYLMWKYAHIKPVMLMEPQLYMNHLNGKSYPAYRLWTRRLSFFTRWRKLIYPEGKRIVKESLLNRMGDLGLAVWYMDDGGMVINYDRRGRPRGRHLELHIHGFTPHDCDIIVHWFKNRLNMHTRLQYDGACDRNGIGNKLRLCIPATEGYAKLLPRIAQYVNHVPSMHHKIDFKYAPGQTPRNFDPHYYKPSRSAQQVLQDFADRRDSRCLAKVRNNMG